VPLALATDLQRVVDEERSELFVKRARRLLWTCSSCQPMPIHIDPAEVNVPNSRWYTASVAATMISFVLATAACTSQEAASNSERGSVPAASGANDGPTTGPSRPLAASTGLGADPCSDAPPATNVANSNGNAIESTLTSQSGGGGGWNIALPADAMDQYPDLLNEGKFSGFDALDAAINDGVAFAYGGTRISLQIGNRTNKHMSIYDIRPVNTRNVCPPAGLLVQYGTEGGDFVALTFNLAAARPIAHERLESGEVSTKPYFGENPTIDVPVNDPLDMSLDFSASTSAYSFDIGIFYIVDGAKFTQVIRGSNGPFLTTASDCPNPAVRRTLNDAEVARLRSHRYQEIRQRASDERGQYVVEAVAPHTYANQCDAW
jgi:hypothetical protein